MNIYEKVFLKKEKSLAILIDPEEVDFAHIALFIRDINRVNEVSAIFVGGSLVTNNNTQRLIVEIQKNTKKPVLLFPGSTNQICKADAILFLSLISGRNPEYLIGQQIISAPLIKQLRMESISTGYILAGNPSTTSYITNTTPLPIDNSAMIKATAIAGEMLGNALLYIDAGSGSHTSVPTEVVRSVYNSINIPLIIGGGIKSYEVAKNILNAGAHCIVVGNGVEEDPSILVNIARAVSEASHSLNVN